MGTIGVLCSIIAAFASIVTVIFSYLMWRDSKRNLFKQIDKRKREISQIDNSLFRRYGPDYSGRGPINPLEEKKRKLQSEINYRKRLL